MFVMYNQRQCSAEKNSKYFKLSGENIKRFLNSLMKEKKTRLK